MAGYLIAVNYTVLGANGKVLLGAADGFYSDAPTALSDAINFVTAYRLVHGETITNVTSHVSQTR